MSPTAELNWTPLQADICMSVALAKRDVFIGASQYVAELVRLGLLSRAAGADTLHEAAIYNQLYFEYGRDHIQEIMAVAFNSEAAA
jgi:hypothetical protein